MNTDESPEHVLLEILALDGERIRDFANRWINEYLEAGECGLAYEGLVGEIEDGNYVPSKRARELIGQVAKLLNAPCPRKGM